MAKLYIQGVTKDFCIEFKQKQTEFLVQYGAETDSLYQKRPTDHEKIDEIQNNIDLIEERSLCFATSISMPIFPALCYSTSFLKRLRCFRCVGLQLFCKCFW